MTKNTVKNYVALKKSTSELPNTDKPPHSKFLYLTTQLLYTAVYSPGPGRERILDVTLDGNLVRYSVKAHRWRSLALVSTKKLAS